MDAIEQHNPDWLSIAVFNDTFDWTKSIRTTFTTFFEYVTLHDSYWQTINLTVTNETILSIQLDAFWNKEYTLKSEETDNWPFLIIKIPKILNISYNPVDDATTILETSCHIMTTEEIGKLISILTQSNLFSKDFYDKLASCKEVNKTRFIDVYGGNIEILHDSEILILLLDENGNYIDPSLDKVTPFDSQNEEKKNNRKGFMSKITKWISFMF